MTKSTITRERIELIANFHRAMTLPPSHDEIEELARMALAAMDSEPVTVPEHITYISEPTILNILANDESSPMANAARLLAHEVRFWRSVPLYRHAQPAVSKPWGYTSGILNPAVGMACVTPTRGKNQFPVYLDPQPAPVAPDAATAIRACLSEFPESARDIVEECADIAENACRAAMLQSEPVMTANKLGNSPVIPDGYVMVPMRLTAENGAKGALSGEFSETKFVNCPECFGDDECETCDGSGRIEIKVPVSWTTIKV